MNGNTPITHLKGIGEKTSKLFQKVGVYTLRDILLYFPTNYIQFPVPVMVDEITEEGIYSIKVTLTQSPITKVFGSKSITTLTISDTTIPLRVTWFQSPYIKNVLATSRFWIFYGKVTKYGKEYRIDHPQLFLPEQYKLKQASLQPVYNLTKGLTNNLIHKFVALALENCQDIEDLLPRWIRNQYDFSDFKEDLEQIHFPITTERFLQAREHLVYEELFQFVLQIQKSKEILHLRTNQFSIRPIAEIGSFTEYLPFQLTKNQKETLMEINHSISSNISMQRLLQGDVGCGKTIIAFLSMIQVGLSGYQSALMAPTDVLARQHYHNLLKLLEQFQMQEQFSVILLTGTMKASERKKALLQIKTITNGLIIGTHALFQETVEYHNLAYIIIDEQHRFGVRQRDLLCQKNHHPHLLVMSATPIPRTLAMILYGDLDVSTIFEMPANRIPIKNCVIKSLKRPVAYHFIEKELQNGHQAYVICHLIEEHENSEFENVISYGKKLEEFFQNKYQIGILHGKMNPAQKEEIMNQFSEKKIDVLVSTTVIEVGIDVPNATVILIEDAQAFGLSQLHQLRGRVGRSNLQSYCIMIDSSKKAEENPRLKICNHSNNGFEISQKDLEMRGPGDFFGIRQSGEMNFLLADIYQDAKILQNVNQDVKKYLELESGKDCAMLHSLFADHNFII